jgi:hypothetical protein
MRARPLLAPLLLGALAGCGGSPALPTALHGEWALVLDDAQSRQLRLLRMGLGPPAPDPAAVAALPPEDRAIVEGVLAAITRDPASPEVAELRGVAATLEGTRLHIDARAFTLRVGAREERGVYTVLAEERDLWRIRSTDARGAPDESVLRRLDAAHIALESPEDARERMVFTRP